MCVTIDVRHAATGERTSIPGRTLAFSNWKLLGGVEEVVEEDCGLSEVLWSVQW